MNLALVGYGGVGRAFARLLEKKQQAFPFRITAIHTLRHGTAYGADGLSPEPQFGPAASSIEEFLEKSGSKVAMEITTLNPSSGEPAISNIRAAFRRRMHVITANKGPLAFAYSELCEEARRADVKFRFESTCMDGAPVFNMVRNHLPGVRILGFTGVLNSTTSVIIDHLRRGHSMEDGIAEARRLGIAEADASYDMEGWDSAAKAAALANVFLNANVTPTAVDRKGIGRLTADRMMDLAGKRKTVRLVCRAHTNEGGVRLRVRAEVLDETDVLASVQGTSNLLLLHTDLMGTVGTVCIDPGVDQTAYGLFSDLVDIANNP